MSARAGSIRGGQMVCRPGLRVLITLLLLLAARMAGAQGIWFAQYPPNPFGGSSYTVEVDFSGAYGQDAYCDPDFPDNCTYYPYDYGIQSSTFYFAVNGQNQTSALTVNYSEQCDYGMRETDPWRCDQSGTATGTATLLAGQANTLSTSIYTHDWSSQITDSYSYNPPAAVVAVSAGPVLSAAMLSQSGMTVNSFAFAVDGDPMTHAWHTDNSTAGAYLQLDLGTSYPLTSVSVHAQQGYSGVYDVRYSDNASTWTTVASGFHPNTGWRAAAWAPAGSHRYWRLVLTNTPGPGAWLDEIVVTPGGAPALAGRSGRATYTLTNTGSGDAKVRLTASCSGAGIQSGSCEPAMDGIFVGAGQSAVVGVAYRGSTDGGSASTSLTAVDSKTGATIGSASYTTTTAAPSLAVVDVPTFASGTTIERDQCLTIAIVEDAASQCGVLRITHPLPSVRTRNKVRTPTLVYYGDFVYAPTIAVNVTLPSTTTIPDEVQLIVSRILPNGSSDWQFVRNYPGTAWASNRARRLSTQGITIDWNAFNRFQVDVKLRYGTSWQTASNSILGEMVFASHWGDAMGSGWWLAGVERLFGGQWDGSLLWVGGDGSTRKYLSDHAVAGGDIMTAVGVDRVDSLYRASNGSTFIRYLPHGGSVVFDAYGRHQYTITRLNDTTTFGWVGTEARLQTITLPGGLHYDFAYDGGNRLASITAPPIGSQTRVTRLERVSIGGQPGRGIERIIGPTNDTMHFEFQSWGNEDYVFARTDRRGTRTEFWFEGWSPTLGYAWTSLGAGGNVAHSFRTAKGMGAVPNEYGGVAEPLDSVFFRYDGPRTDVADVSSFWLDSLGAPTRIVNAMGYETRVARGDPRFAALATRVQDATGHVASASYDDHGNLLASYDRSPLDASGNGKDAAAHYHWDRRWDFADSVTSAEGVVSTFQYDATTGNRLWQQTGPSSSRRVNFSYTGFGQLQSTTAPGTGPDLVTYDATLRNLASYRTPLGYTTTYVGDEIGRDTLVRSPIDVGGSLIGLQRTVYDAAGRDSLSQTIGPAMSGAPSQTITVVQLYDKEDNRLSLARSSSPDAANVGTITTRWHYDPIGRVDYETAPDGKADTSRYDYAGNVTWQFTRRGHNLLMSYDALNRLTNRSVPGVTYHDTLAGIGTRDNEPYPRKPNSGTDYVIDPQSETFTYDAVNRMLTANNGDAHVTRTYYPSGALKTEDQQLRDASGTTFSHDYLLQFTYNLDGQRTAVKLPSQLVLAGTRDSVARTYSATTAELSTVTDPLGNVFTYGYSDRGDVTSLAHPGSYTERWGYNADGSVTGDTIFNFGGTGSPRLAASQGRAMTFTYDARGKIQTSHDATGYQQDVSSTYTGLGYLATNHTWQHGQLQGYSITDTYATGEQQSYDGLGNMYSALTADTTWYNSSLVRWSRRNRLSSYQSGVGRLLTESSADGSKTYRYDPAGNLEFSMRAPTGFGTPIEDRFTYYGADNKVRAADFRQVANGDQIITPEKWVFEEYRYDALGRRVWVRTYRDCENVSYSTLDYLECSQSLLRRTVWDGNQELMEIQVPGASTETSATLEGDDQLLHRPRDAGYNDPNPLFGRVVYIHGLSFDQPIAVTRYRYVDFFYGRPYTDFTPRTYSLFFTPLGQMGLGLCADGSRACSQNGYDMGLEYPASMFAYDRPKFVKRVFQGSLILDKEDAAGTLYRRNRAYDPATGRFTQEDPIGLAGGLNLYGFASGDPINYSDPLGLCPMCLGALGGVAMGYGLAVLTGSDYTWKDAAIDAALGAAGVGLAGKFAKIGRVAVAAAEEAAVGAAEGSAEGVHMVATSELRATHGVSRKAVERLAADVEKNGIQEPLKYVEHQGEKHVVDGNHRLRVARKLGMKEVPAERVDLPYRGFKTPGDLTYTP